MENNNPFTREAIETRFAKKLTDEQWDFLYEEMTDDGYYGEEWTAGDDNIEDWLADFIANIDFYRSPYSTRN
jgi:hypothetical protein